MKNSKYIRMIATIFSVLLLLSCGSKHSEGDGHGHEKETHSEGDGHGHEEEGEGHEEGLHLTREQAETIGLEFGDLMSIKVNDYVKTTGTLGLPPNAYSSVTAKSSGIIKGTNKYVEGNYIKKGEIIAYLENPDFIIKQQEYLETKAQLKLKNYDLERQQNLVDANAGVTKNLQMAEAEVAILEAKSVSLSKQLAYLGISTSNLTPSSIQQQIAIVAPMSGYISIINFHNGMFAQSSVSLMEIISSDHLHLELNVFEKDIAKITKGQKISYTVPALGTTIYNGEVSVIGKEFDSQSKTVRIHGHLEGNKPIFLKDLFIDAKIWLNDNTTNSLPEKAIIDDGESSFIYVAKNEQGANEIEFEKISVFAGATNNGFTAVKLMNEIPEGMKIVTKGAYYVYAQEKAGALTHEH
jgi:cobalt-zinc-cadmium efflux system membrane fusion protein